MSTTLSSAIWRERVAAEQARREFQKAAMQDYDRDVYYPAMQAMRARCADIGHRAQEQLHDNGIGWRWRYCNQCGQRVELTGPES